MKYAVAILLLCLPAQAGAAERCTAPRGERGDGARLMMSTRPPAARIEVPRTKKIRVSPAIQRLLLIEQQIL